MTSPWHAHFDSLQKQVTSPPIVAAGKLVRGIGLTLEAVGCQLPVGSQCLVQTIEGEIEAEVVGFATGDITRGKAFGVAVPDVDILLNVDPTVLTARLHGRWNQSGVAGAKLDLHKLHKSAIRACTDRL